MKIRQARCSDAAAIAKVKVDTWHDRFGIVDARRDINYQDQEEHFAGLLCPDQDKGDQGEFGFLLVACEQAGRIIGYGRGGRQRGSNSHWQAYQGEVYGIYILPAFQHLGAGRLLIAGLAQRFFAAGIHSLIVHTPAQHSARHFYEALDGHDLGVHTIQLGDSTTELRSYGWANLENLASQVA